MWKEILRLRLDILSVFQPDLTGVDSTNELSWLLRNLLPYKYASESVSADSAVCTGAILSKDKMNWERSRDNVAQQRLTSSWGRLSLG